jgi:Protein of unknown function (DUF3515)
VTAAPPDRRRASPALLATAVALPVTVVLVLLFARLAGGDDSPEVAPATPTAVALPAIPVSPPPTLSEAAQKACQELVSALPTTLGDRPARPVQSSSPYVAAWGDPAVVLRCGVATPAGYAPDSQVFDISGVRWFPVARGSSTVWTVVNKSVRVEVTAPTTEASSRPPSAAP